MPRAARTAAGLLLVVATWLAAALGWTRPVAAAGLGAPLPNWLVSNTAIHLLDNYEGNGILASNAFDNASSEVSHGMPGGWSSQRTASFDAYGPASTPGSLLYALENGTIAGGTTYLIYDDENWAMTPLVEQQDPAPFMSAFVAAAHEYGYMAILAPATDLTSSMGCHDPAASTWDNYLYNCGLPTLAAAAAPDIFDIQSQSFENDTSSGTRCGCYSWFVSQSEARAVSVDPGVEVFAGLSSNPGGATSTPDALYTDTLNTESLVNGYWLNVPQRSASCPDCLAGGAPDVAAGYLHLMGYAGQGSQSISVTSASPTGATYAGPAYTIGATGGNSGNPVTFSSGSPAVCSVSGSEVSFVGVGTCIVYADQAGNADFAPAAQAVQTIPVGQSGQTISFGASAPADAVVGASYTPAPAGGGSGNPIVLAVDPASDAGVCAVVDSTISFTGVGTCVVEANEAGNTDYTAAQQATEQIPVGPGAQSVAFTTTPPSVYYDGPSYTVDATGGGSGNPVVFSVDPASGPGVCDVAGSTISFTGAGTCVVDANQAGSANFAPAAQATQSIAVGQEGQSIAFTSSPPAGVVYGTTYTVSADGGGSGNEVVFSTDAASGPGVCGVTGSTVSFTGAGTCVVDANDAGSADYAAAPQATLTIAVGPAAQSVNFTSVPPTDATYGGVSYSAAAAGGPSGEPVVFSVDPASGPGVCMIAGSAVSFTGVGTCVVDANEAASADYTAAPQATQSIPVGQAPQAVNFTSTPYAATFGSTYIIAASGGGSGDPVTFSSGSPGVCTVAGPAVSFVGAGTCLLEADQAGNGDYYAAARATQSFAVARAPQAITFTSAAPAGASFGGAGYAVGAGGGGSGRPVTISAGNPSVCTVAGSTVAYVGVGTCVVLADQEGNAEYMPATEQAQRFAVGRAPQRIAFTSAAPVKATFKGTYTVSAVGGASGSVIAFSSGNPAICTVTGAMVAFVGVGTCVIDAGQGGSADFFAAPPDTQRFVVGKAPQAIQFTSLAPTNATFNGPTYTVTASGGASGGPVTFLSSAPTICRVTGSKVAFVGAGTCVLEANQAANADYYAAPMAVQRFAVARSAHSKSRSVAGGPGRRWAAGAGVFGGRSAAGAVGPRTSSVGRAGPSSAAVAAWTWSRRIDAQSSAMPIRFR